jgi:hypothetical protein
MYYSPSLLARANMAQLQVDIDGVPTTDWVMTNRLMVVNGIAEALDWWMEHKLDGETWSGLASSDRTYTGSGIDDLEAMVLAGGVEDYEEHGSSIDKNAKVIYKDKDGNDKWILYSVDKGSNGLVMEVYKDVQTGEVVVAIRASNEYAKRISDGQYTERPEVQEALEKAGKLLDTYGNIAFVGMDRGGALAQLCALKYNQPATVFNSGLTPEMVRAAGLLPNAINNRVNPDGTKIKGYTVGGSLNDSLTDENELFYDDIVTFLRGISIAKGTVNSIIPDVDKIRGGDLEEIGGLTGGAAATAVGTAAEMAAGKTLSQALLAALGLWGLGATVLTQAGFGAFDTMDENTKRDITMRALAEIYGLSQDELRELMNSMEKYKENPDPRD